MQEEDYITKYINMLEEKINMKMKVLLKINSFFPKIVRNTFYKVEYSYCIPDNY